MSCENEAVVSEWTVDTLRLHLLERSELLAAAIRQQILDQHDATHQKMADLQTSIAQRLADMRALLDERHATQTKAIDEAFRAQRAAVRTALDAADKAVQAALVSAEKAVEKAEVASDKRFESVNEFRQQLTDQTATFPTRNEVTSKFEALREQTDVNGRRIAELELRLTSRLDTEQGTRAGGRESRVEYRAEVARQRAGNGQIMQFAGLVLLTVAIATSVLVAVLQ